MNDDRPANEPDELDELLSAELDGELDAVARERGLTVDEVLARLRATPGSESRRRALASARDVLAVPPEIDELLAARLRAKALRAADAARAERADTRKRRRQRMLASVAGVAAAALAVVGIAAGLRSQPASKTSSASDAALSPSAPSPGPARSESGAGTTGRSATKARMPPALGPFTNAHQLALAAVLQSQADQVLQGPADTTAGDSGFSTDNKSLSGSTTTLRRLNDNGGSLTPTGGGSSSAQQGAKAAGADNANGACSNTSAPTPTSAGPVLRATATLSGTPVIVLVFAGTDEHTVVIEDTACKLLRVEMLP